MNCALSFLLLTQKNPKHLRTCRLWLKIKKKLRSVENIQNHSQQMCKSAKKRIIDGFIDLPDKKCRRYERVWVSCWNALLANFSKQMCPLCISQSGWVRFFFRQRIYFFLSFYIHSIWSFFFFIFVYVLNQFFFIKHFFLGFFLYSIVRSLFVCELGEQVLWVNSS